MKGDEGEGKRDKGDISFYCENMVRYVYSNQIQLNTRSTHPLVHHLCTFTLNRKACSVSQSTALPCPKNSRANQEVSQSRDRGLTLPIKSQKKSPDQKPPNQKPIKRVWQSRGFPIKRSPNQEVSQPRGVKADLDYLHFLPLQIKDYVLFDN